MMLNPNLQQLLLGGSWYLLSKDITCLSGVVTNGKYSNLIDNPSYNKVP